MITKLISFLLPLKFDLTNFFQLYFKINNRNCVLDLLRYVQFELFCRKFYEMRYIAKS